MENLTYISPEITLAIFAMASLMYGVFSNGETKTLKIFNLNILISIGLIYLLFNLNFRLIDAEISLFGDSFIFDKYSYYLKTLTLFGFIAISIISIGNGNFAGTRKNCFEFPVLVTLSVIGMFILISANDLIVMYLGLELMSLASYVLVAINRDNESATESGVKYFILGALASGIILFASSLIYGFSGSTNLAEIFALLNVHSNTDNLSPALIMGFVLLFAGMFFKISAVPMHMWAPDVYEGSSKVVVAFLSTLPKIAALAFIIRLVSGLSNEIYSSFSLIFVFVAAASMIVGSFTALKQENIKRLLAYSSIANMGYLLIAVSIGTKEAFEAAILFLIIYIIGTLGIFAVISLLKRNVQEFNRIDNLSGLSKTNPVYALALAILMFSIAGIPPFAGFWGKLYIFIEAIRGEYYILAVIGILSSVVACFYYIRIVKVMYFDEAPAAGGNIIEPVTSKLVKILIAFSVIFAVSLSMYISEFLYISGEVVSSLF
jgi:NADH-quinone oxidoreductase subunit N